MFKWKVGFVEDTNGAKKMMKKLLPLDIMGLTSSDLNKQFTVYPFCCERYAHSNCMNWLTHSTCHSTRELVFKLYEIDDCKILHLTGKNSVHAISELLSELPPVYIFHAELSLINERFTDLSCLNILNTIYAIKINGCTELFLYNLEKVVEEGLQFYWIE